MSVKTNPKLALAATIVLAAAFTYTCSFFDDSSNGGTCPTGISGTFQDDRDNKTYKWVKICDQTWMAENLSYDPGTIIYDQETGRSNTTCYKDCTTYEDRCYDDCDTYGRYYDWATAMESCPAGWHLPTTAEWDKLFRSIDGKKGPPSSYIASETAGRYLKSKQGWHHCGPSGSGNPYLCEDTYGFSALPGGGGGTDYYIGLYGYFWTSTQTDDRYAYSLGMQYEFESTDYTDSFKPYLHNIRCLQNN
jgi:uncharacterized protein (TIGR02145 family)